MSLIETTHDLGATLQSPASSHLDILEQLQGLIILCRNTEIAFINSAGLKHLGYRSSDDLIGLGIETVLHPEYRSLLSIGMGVLTEEGAIPLKLMHRTGSDIDVEIWVREVNQDGPSLFMIEARDITEHLRTAKTLRAREQWLEGIINTVADGIISLDGQGTIQSFNAAAERMFKFNADEIVGRNIRHLMPEPIANDLRNHADSEWLHVLNMGPEIEGKRKDGKIFPMEIAVRELAQGNQRSYTGVVRDISERKRAENQIRHQAYHDALTALPNRILFGDRLDAAISRAKRQQTTLALMFLDLNKFKPINDTYGHAVGDKILIAIAKRLRSSVRETDTVARVGGDEFVIVLEDVKDTDQIRAMSDAICSTVCMPIDINNHQHSVGVSIGVSICPDQATGAEELIHLADLAMYEAKPRH